MLPIDEHAKSGAWVWCRHPLRATLHYVRFNGSEWWDGERTYPENFFLEHLPAPWVENAGKMREALHDAYVYGWKRDQNVHSLLAATEWPPKKEKADD